LKPETISAIDQMIRYKMHRTRFCKAVFLAWSTIVASLGQAEQQQNPFFYEDERLVMQLSHPSPEQISAFYMGRGFKQPAIDLLARFCFISVRIKNKNQDVLWLDLQHWKIHDQQMQPIHFISQQQWRDKWKEIDLPLPHQSTFRWTQLPETRDLRPDEPVGGNIVIPWQDQAFTLVATFPTGADQSGTPVILTFEDQKCANSPGASSF
jgi:hypothetical protein